MRNLKDIALELLDKYEDSEMGCISEGISIMYDINELEDECKWYREEIEAADVVKVVRCKDCIHRPTGTGANHDLEFPDYVCPCQCEDYWYSWMPDDDWFCANGKRKETEDAKSNL